MISGRGLGHTGGTLDKLSAIQGYDVRPDVATFRTVVREVGCAIIGQTDNLAPADRRLYGVRDVTATVESIPLIVSSILSKKIAAGLDGLVMDVKCGSGAFCDTEPMARDLAQSLVAVSHQAGLSTAALITDIGNDILYEVPVAQIISWVQISVERLQTIDATICVTLPPIDSARGLSLRKFLFFRKLFFPRCRLQLNEVRERAHQLNDGIAKLAVSHGVKVAAQRGEWYGFDPIHIRLRHWRHAWFSILEHWSDADSAAHNPARGSLTRWTYLRTRAPDARRLFGKNMRKNQPSARFRSGTHVSFF
jgi:hypothetical protein